MVCLEKCKQHNGFDITLHKKEKVWKLLKKKAREKKDRKTRMILFHVQKSCDAYAYGEKRVERGGKRQTKHSEMP